MKNGLIREMASLEGDNLVVFYCASEIWFEGLVNDCLS
jgi:hypothetical protein